jgi:AraC-like DNA-binding protein
VTDVPMSVPLGRFPLARTTHVDQFAEIVRPIYGKISLQTAKPSAAFDAVANYYHLFNSGIYYGQYGIGVSIQIPNSEFVAQGVTLQGNGKCIIDKLEENIEEGRLPNAVLDSRRVSLDFDDTHRHLAFCMDPQVLKTKASALLGEATDRPLRINPDRQASATELSRFRRLLMMLIAEIDMDEAPLSPVFLREIEQTLMVCFLLGYQNNFTEVLQPRPRAIAPWQVKRVEHFIEAHWNEALTMESISAAVGAGVRSIQMSFQANRGYTPMEFVRQVRLGHARKMLLEGPPTTTVTDVAYACCFGNIGHFSRQYFDRFQELPSTTLARTRNRPRGP